MTPAAAPASTRTLITTATTKLPKNRNKQQCQIIRKTTFSTILSDLMEESHSVAV